MRISTAQTNGPSGYFLGTEDRNGDGVSDLNDGLSLYAVTDGQAARLNADGENVRNYLPRFDDGTAAYVAQQANGSLTLTLVGPAARHSAPLTGLSNAVVQRYDDHLWLTAQDESKHFIIAGYDLELKETAQVTVTIAALDIAFDPTGEWVSAYNDSAQTLLLYHLPDLTPVTLPSSLQAMGPPTWAHRSARLAVPVTSEDGNGVRVALIEPPATVTPGTTLDLITGSTRAVQLQWSAGDTYLTYRTLPGVDPGSTLPLRLIQAQTQTVTNLDETDLQLRVVNGSDDDRYALVSEATTDIAGQIGINYRLFNVTTGQFAADSPINTFVTPVAFAWKPGTHVLGIVGKSLVDGRPGLFSYDADSGTLSTLYNGDDGDLRQSNLFWSGDGTTLLFTAQLTDPLSELTGTTNTLRQLVPTAGAATILSPEGVSVLPYGIRQR